MFEALLTQWRMKPTGGVVGLDYSAIPHTLELMAIDRAEWSKLFEQVRVMENEAVKVINGDT